MMVTMKDANQLGSFLRSRREQLTPADVGLPDIGRRRTPGLRREEVAALAGVSNDYLVRLEQGRDRHPSPSVIGALAEALRLDPDERAHLAQLVACSSSPELCPVASGAADAVPATVRTLLDRLEPTPAVVLGPWYQVLAYNNAWAAIMRPVGALDEAVPNLARFTFLDPRSRKTYPAWSELADEQAAVLRAAAIRWRTDDRLRALLDELFVVPEFTTRWWSHDVTSKRRGTKVLIHPRAGSLRIDYEVLMLADDSDQRMITWLPADDATQRAFDQLCTRDLDSHSPTATPPHLRVVG
jgi:transcriptional regulator with XRE-family HTH domain